LWCCGAMMQSFNLNNVQNYFSSCIYLLLQLHNICKYGCFSLGFGQQLICYLQIFDDSKGKSKIYKSTMQQSRHHCVALYLEEEYEMLALEAHFDVKQPNIPTFGNRPSFQCKFCKIMFKDKNNCFTTRWWTCALSTLRRNCWKCTPPSQSLKLKNLWG